MNVATVCLDVAVGTFLVVAGVLVLVGRSFFWSRAQRAGIRHARLGLSYVVMGIAAASFALTDASHALRPAMLLALPPLLFIVGLGLMFWAVATKATAA